MAMSSLTGSVKGVGSRELREVMLAVNHRKEDEKRDVYGTRKIWHWPPINVDRWMSGGCGGSPSSGEQLQLHINGSRVEEGFTPLFVTPEMVHEHSRMVVLL